MSIERTASGEAAGRGEAPWCGDPLVVISVESAGAAGFSALGAGTFFSAGAVLAAGALAGCGLSAADDPPLRSAARLSITSVRVTWLREWIALITATSKCSFLLGAHFIRPSA